MRRNQRVECCAEIGEVGQERVEMLTGRWERSKGERRLEGEEERKEEEKNVGNRES